MKNKYNRQDKLYKKAKQEGYRSRAAYKLLELDQQFRILKPGMKIVELGAWPGGWLQVAASLLNGSGRLVGIDLAEIEPLSGDNILTIKGDVADPLVIENALAFLGAKADLIISDMAPKLCGIREADMAAQENCVNVAYHACLDLLRVGGNFVIKLFNTNESSAFVKNLKPVFNTVQRVELESSRSTSDEFYCVAKGLKAASAR